MGNGLHVCTGCIAFSWGVVLILITGDSQSLLFLACLLHMCWHPRCGSRILVRGAQWRFDPREGMIFKKSWGQGGRASRSPLDPLLHPSRILDKTLDSDLWCWEANFKIEIYILYMLISQTKWYEKKNLILMSCCHHFMSFVHDKSLLSSLLSVCVCVANKNADFPPFFEHSYHFPPCWFDWENRIIFSSTRFGEGAYQGPGIG